MEDKWYSGDFGRLVGMGVLCLGIGVGMGSCMEGCAEEKKSAHLYRASRVERKRLETIQEIAKERKDITTKELTDMINKE
jgi:hypothetical protein